MTFAFD